MAERVAAVLADEGAVQTDGGDRLPYDSLLVAVGASAHPAYPNALTFRGAQDTERLHGLVQDLEGGYDKRFAFVVPPAHTWPLPLYELALMTAERARSLSLDDVRVTLVTPEDAPLAVFGGAGGEAVPRRRERSASSS